MCRKHLVFLSAILVLSGVGGASRAQTNAPRAEKFDEFGDIRPTEMAARLDNFGVQLQEHPTARAFLIVYRAHRDLPGLSGRHLNWMKRYLINNRGIPTERIAAVDGGAASCLSHELWLVPPGTAPAPRPDAYARGLDDTAAARKFDEYYWDAPHDQLISYSSEYGGTLEDYAQALRKEPRSLAYLIAYAGYRVSRTEDVDARGRKKIFREVSIDPPGAAARELRERRDEMVKQHGIPRSRVRVLDGGYRKWRALELWIVPPGEYAPVPTPNAFPRAGRAPRRR
jgi:hypothetical protein